ncbi:MAG: response regulator transcription factor [Rhizobiaceae bacterium]
MFIALEDRVHFGDMVIVHQEIDERPSERTPARPIERKPALPSARAALRPGAPADLVAAAEKLITAGYRVTPGPELRQADDTAHAGKFSAREREVLAQLAEGAPNKVIARRLDISVHTAKFHVAAIIAKLDAANRTDAIAIAMREGLIGG